MAKKQTSKKKKETEKLQITMSVQEVVEDMLNNVIKEKIKERIPDDFLDKIIYKKLSGNIETIVEYVVNNYIENYDPYMEVEKIESLLKDIVLDNDNFYKTMIQNILNKLLETSKVQQKISKHIMNNYINNIQDVCVVGDLISNCFENYEFRLVLKKKGKK